MKNESCKSYLGNKEQKAMFLVVFRSNVHFDFACPFFAYPNGLERNFSSPENATPIFKLLR